MGDDGRIPRFARDPHVPPPLTAASRPLSVRPSARLLGTSIAGADAVRRSRMSCRPTGTAHGSPADSASRESARLAQRRCVQPLAHRPGRPVQLAARSDCGTPSRWWRRNSSQSFGSRYASACAGTGKPRMAHSPDLACGPLRRLGGNRRGACSQSAGASVVGQADPADVALAGFERLGLLQHVVAQHALQPVHQVLFVADLFLRLDGQQFQVQRLHQIPGRRSWSSDVVCSSQRMYVSSGRDTGRPTRSGRRCASPGGQGQHAGDGGGGQRWTAWRFSLATVCSCHCDARTTLRG